MFLLDTNVTSELIRLRPDPAVSEWVFNQERESLFLSVITIGELRKGFAVSCEPKTNCRVYGGGWWQLDEMLQPPGGQTRNWPGTAADTAGRFRAAANSRQGSYVAGADFPR